MNKDEITAFNEGIEAAAQWLEARADPCVDTGHDTGNVELDIALMKEQAYCAQQIRLLKRRG